MGLPVATCSSPSSSMMPVPDAGPVAEDAPADGLARTARAPRAESRADTWGTGAPGRRPSSPSGRWWCPCRRRARRGDRRSPRATARPAAGRRPRRARARRGWAGARRCARARARACPTRRRRRRRRPAAHRRRTPSSTQTKTRVTYVLRVGVRRRRRPCRPGAPSAPRPRVRLEEHLAQMLHGDVRVQLRGRHVGVAEHLLHAAQVGAAGEQMGRERVAERVGAGAARACRRARGSCAADSRGPGA